MTKPETCNDPKDLKNGQCMCIESKHYGYAYAPFTVMVMVMVMLMVNNTDMIQKCNYIQNYMSKKYLSFYAVLHHVLIKVL